MVSANIRILILSNELLLECKNPQDSVTLALGIPAEVIRSDLMESVAKLYKRAGDETSEKS